MSSIKKNLGLQSLYQVLAIGMPLITSPYLSRVLGAKQLGIYLYTGSVVAYFSLFAMLGTVNYGTRSVTAVRANNLEKNKVFSNIYMMQLFSSIIALFAYIIFLVFFCKENKLASTLQIIALLSCMLDINWLYWGIALTVKRNIIVKLLTVVSIIVFVNSENDLRKTIRFT